MTDFKVGDRVRAMLVETVLVGEVRSADSDGYWCTLAVEGTAVGIHVYPADGWRIEKVSPPLPTKVGAIVRRADGTLFVYDGAIRDPWMKLDGSGGGVGSGYVSEGGFEVIFEGVDA